MFFCFVFRDWLHVAAIGLTQYLVDMHLIIVRVVLDMLLTVIATNASLSWRCEIICLIKTCMIVHVHQPICPLNYGRSHTWLQPTVSIVVAMVSTHVIRTNKEETVTCPWSCPHLLHVWASKHSLWLSKHSHVFARCLAPCLHVVFTPSSTFYIFILLRHSFSHSASSSFLVSVCQCESPPELGGVRAAVQEDICSLSWITVLGGGISSYLCSF